MRLTGILLFLSIAGIGASNDASLSGALLARGAKEDQDAIDLEHSLLGKGCSFCVQINFQANFDKLAQAIAGVASEVGQVEKTLDRMAKNFTREMADIAKGIEDLAHSVESLGADMLLHIVAMRGFLDSVKAEIDLGILVTELQTSIARITHRQTLLAPLLKDKSALNPEQKTALVTAILDINEGSDMDTQIIHGVLTGQGGVVPGVQPAMSVYMKKGYRLQDLAKVWGALFIYQMHGYGQLFWADLNKQPDIELLSYNQSQNESQTRLLTQWQNYGSPFMWHCYWDDGFVCPEKQECYTGLRGLETFACNHATAPLTIDMTTGVSSFTLGAASSQLQLQFVEDARTATCLFGVKDCAGSITAPVPFNATSKASNFSCTAAVSAELTGGVFILYPYGKTNGTNYILANLSASKFINYSLFVNETGALAIIGENTSDAPNVLWTNPPPPPPASGVCPTDFTKRQLKAQSLESCHCIQSAQWRRVAAGKANMTASWCGRLCQADTQYVAAAPRADGECWCATPEVYAQSRKDAEATCDAKCTFCPGAPVETCGTGNSVAVFTWSSAKTPISILV